MSVVDRFRNWQERKGGTAVLLSVLVHFTVVVLLLTDVLLPHSKPTDDQPTAIEVSLVPEPAARQPAPAPEPPAPEPAPAQQPPPPPPQPPQDEPEPPPPTPMARPTPPIPEPPKPPSKPILQEGKLAEESKAASPDAKAKPEAKHSWLDDADQGDSPKTSQSTAPDGQVTQPMNLGKGGSRSQDEGQATQSERDFLLSQILKPWRNRPSYNWPADAIVRLRVEVMPDGYLAQPFNARQRYAPDLAIVDYHRLAPNDPRRVMLESLYSVLRVAQPLTLPPELKAKAPFVTVLDFKLVDIP